MTQNEIFEALMRGENPDTLAQNFTLALNNAVKQKKAADEVAAKKKAEEEAKKRAAEELNKNKIIQADRVMAAILTFLKEFYPEVYDDALTQIKGKDLVEALDLALKSTTAWTISFPKENKKKNFAQVSADPIQAFLKLNSLL